MIKNTVVIIALLALAVIGYRALIPNDISASESIGADYIADLPTQSDATADNFNDFPDIAPTYVEAASSSAAPRFHCDGRQHCSQMSSCAEATYFIQHCPNTKMDGNNDGVPCEQQWCP